MHALFLKYNQLQRKTPACFFLNIEGTQEKREFLYPPLIRFTALSALTFPLHPFPRARRSAAPSGTQQNGERIRALLLKKHKAGVCAEFLNH